MGKKSKKKRIKKLKKELLKLEGKKGSKKAHNADLSAVGTDLAIIEPQAPTVKKTGISRLMPQDAESLKELAQLMAKGGPMIGKAFREKPGACAAIIMQAVRYNMDPFALSLEAYMVNDSIGYSGKMIAGIVQSHPALVGKLRFSYSGDIEKRTRQVTISGMFRGETEPHELTTPMLRDIKPQNSPLWKSDPDQQLGYYGARAWGRRYASDIMAGLISHEEAEVAHELDEPRKTNTQKRVEKMKEKKAEAEAAKKAAVEAEAEDAEIIEAEFEDVKPEEETQDTSEDDPTSDSPADEATPSQSSAGQPDLPDEAHDFFELLDTLDTAEAIGEAVKKINEVDWFAGMAEEQREAIQTRVDEKIAEVTGE